MTSSAPPDDGTADKRITALEHGLKHHREIQEMRHYHLVQTIESQQAENRKRDEDLDYLEEKLLTEIEKIRTLLWSGMKWLGGLLAVTLLTIVLRASGLA